MIINDKSITKMEPTVLFSPEVLDALFRIRDKAERSRLQGLMEYRAKEVGVSAEFKSVIKAYQAVQKQLAAEFRKEAAQETGIELDFDGQGRALNTVDNFLKVIEALSRNGQMPMMPRLEGTSKKPTTSTRCRSVTMRSESSSSATSITRSETSSTVWNGMVNHASSSSCIGGRNARILHTRERSAA